ncbi:hypothetical protein Tco_1355911, partial [Tanacetum coccineum]
MLSEINLENDSVASKTTKEKVKSLALKAKVTREQTSDDSDSQGGSDEDVDEEEADALNFMARNFQKGNRFRHRNRFGNGGNKYRRGCRNSFKNKGGESSRQRRGCYNCGEQCHFIGECLNPWRTRPLLEDLGVMVKTVINLKMTQILSWWLTHK